MKYVPGASRFVAIVFGAVLLTACAVEHSCEFTLTCPTDGGSDGSGSNESSSGSQGAEDGGAASSDSEPASLVTEPQEAGVCKMPSTGSLDAGGSCDEGVAGSVDTTSDRDASAQSSEGSAADAGAGIGVEVPIAATSCSESDVELCRGETPVCDLELDQCVRCLLEDDSGCTSEAPYCVGATNDVAKCVACRDEDDCGAAAPQCEPDLGRCVECLSEADCTVDAPRCEAGECTACEIDADCAEHGALGACDADSGRCVVCAEHEDCRDPEASACSGEACIPCTNNAECEHLEDTTLCDVAEGRCVQCLGDNEQPCGDNSCNPETKQCTNTARYSVEVCRPCVADSECGWPIDDPGARCIQLNYRGEPYKAYCLQRVAYQSCPDSLWSIPLMAVSVSGAPAEEYCFINQDLATCEGVWDSMQGIPCENDSDCGCERDEERQCLGPGAGGVCKMQGQWIDKYCTIMCSARTECLLGKSCTEEIPWCHTPAIDP